MSWTAPTTRTTGTLITASIWNTDVIANIEFLKTHVASQIFLSAAGGRPQSTAACATANATNYPTNDVDLVTMDFDPTALERAQWTGFTMPSDYDGGSIFAKYVWTHGAGGTAYGVVFYFQARAWTNGNGVDSAWGSLQQIDDVGASGGSILYISDNTPAITPGGTAAAGCFMAIRATRDVTDALDTMNLDAKLAGVIISYTRSS